MDEEKGLRDDFLAGLLRRLPLESPSVEFQETVMGKIEAMPAYRPQKKTFFQVLKSALPWILLACAFLVFFLTSDLSFIGHSYGKDYVEGFRLPDFSFIIDSFRGLASSKFYSIALVVVISAVFLFGIDRLFSRRMSSNRHYLI